MELEMTRKPIQRITLMKLCIMLWNRRISGSAFSWEFVLYVRNIALILVYLFMITNINKNYGSLKGHGEEYLSALVRVYPIVNGFSRIFVGPLMDYFRFKILYATLNVIVIILSSTIYLVSENATLYFVYNVVSAICLGTNFAIFPTFVSKKFGLK